jgi:hypothetical protein
MLDAFLTTPITLAGIGKALLALFALWAAFCAWMKWTGEW